MLTTINELEKEIDRFHKNIKDSNDLMQILSSVASLTKAQTESFETKADSLHADLEKLSPELSVLFQEHIKEFISEVHEEHQAYQTAVTTLFESFSAKITDAEKSIAEIPSKLATQSADAHKNYLDELNRIETSHTQALNAAMEQHAGKMATVTETILKAPSVLEEQLQKDRSQNADSLKQIQEQYAAELARTNDEFSKQLLFVVESIQAIPREIKNNSAQQNSLFLKELQEIMDARIAQLKETENHVIAMSQQLENKYNEFLATLEATNMDQLYKYCQGMNKSLNMKLGIALAGIATAIVISIISLFI